MYKVCIMISIFQGCPRKIPGSYTLVAGFLICQYTVQYTSCILRETGGILAGLWKVCIRNLTVAAGFLLCQYTVQYTSCILCETGVILGGTWKVCIRNFTVVAKVPSSSGHMSVYSMYTGRIKGYTECGVE